jgi:hypothetical protein
MTQGKREHAARDGTVCPLCMLLSINTPGAEGLGRHGLDAHHRVLVCRGLGQLAHRLLVPVSRMHRGQPFVLAVVYEQ